MQGKVLNPFTGKLVKKGGRVHKDFLKKINKESKQKKQSGIGKEKESKNKLEVFENADKVWHEKWDNNRDIMNIPHPFRCVLCGPPNCGKTSMILNLLIKNKPFFEEVIVIHCDPEYTQEYDDIEAIMIDTIPPPNQWEGEKKTLVILDDLEYKNLPPDQKTNLDRLFGFVSTHKNISVCLSAQDVFNIPAGVRRCSNFWVLWRINDLDALSRLGRRINYSASQLKQLFDYNIENSHDSITIDLTAKSPYPLRKNGTQPIELIE
jgi:hypothetical protein